MELSNSISYMKHNSEEAFENLKTIDSLSVHHGFSLNRAFNGSQSTAKIPKYGILDNRNQVLFYAFEESDPFQRICCTNGRAFTIRIHDNQNREVIRVIRDLQTCSGCPCCSGLCEGCMQKAIIESPPGSLLGSISQFGGGCGMSYMIKDINDQTVLTLMGPSCICNGNYSCGCQNRYVLYGSDHATEIGAIDKHYPESTKIQSANPVAFTLNFPVNLETKMKVILIGALFLIDIGNYNMLRLRR